MYFLCSFLNIALYEAYLSQRYFLMIAPSGCNYDQGISVIANLCLSLTWRIKIFDGAIPDCNVGSLPTPTAEHHPVFVACFTFLCFCAFFGSGGRGPFVQIAKIVTFEHSWCWGQFQLFNQSKVCGVFSVRFHLFEYSLRVCKVNKWVDIWHFWMKGAIERVSEGTEWLGEWERSRQMT